MARTVHIVVYLMLLALAALLAWDNWRTGMAWESDGPQAGYFPFYLSVVLGAACLFGLFFLFGGYDAAGSYLNETWLFDGTTWANVSPPVSPPGRAAAAFAYDSHTNQLVLFGGFNGRYRRDTWIWDTAMLTWTRASPTAAPPAVTGPAGFTDPLNGHADVYGGYDGHFYQLFTWQWDGTTWVELHPATSAYARSAAVAALDDVTNTAVLFGGLGDVRTDNTWTWDGTDWTQQLPADQPPNRYDAEGVRGNDARVLWVPQLRLDPRPARRPEVVR